MWLMMYTLTPASSRSTFSSGGGNVSSLKTTRDLFALQQRHHVAQLARRRRQAVRRLHDAADLEAELLQQIAVAVVHGDDAGDLRVSKLRRGFGFDRAEPSRVVGGVLLKRRGVLRPQPRQSPAESRRSAESRSRTK